MYLRPIHYAVLFHYTRFLTRLKSLKTSCFFSNVLISFIRNIVPDDVSLLQVRNITSEGSHRHLLTTIKLPILNHQSQSQLHELVIIERLPLGVFADPFELQSLPQRIDQTGLSLRSALISVKHPLHARYQPLEESGYSRVEFGEPDLFLCSRLVLNQGQEEIRCLVLAIAGLKTETETRSVVWEIPAGIRNHICYYICGCGFLYPRFRLCSEVEPCKNRKQS
ncbi:uncharacterized protein LOC108808071 [Raphanus sativus]|uniref:Uncharacterized protein LOC108808071 n=1 Tax=Raphanus sativus TaxID=3726 RepID=A0A9W3BVF0_RAPSA|nr:uncharacterized protein LOC108808071 [Raphanus sativus]